MLPACGRWQRSRRSGTATGGRSPSRSSSSADPLRGSPGPRERQCRFEARPRLSPAHHPPPARPRRARSRDRLRRSSGCGPSEGWRNRWLLMRLRSPSKPRPAPSILDGHADEEARLVANDKPVRSFLSVTPRKPGLAERASAPRSGFPRAGGWGVAGGIQFSTGMGGRSQLAPATGASRSVLGGAGRGRTAPGSAPGPRRRHEARGLRPRAPEPARPPSQTRTPGRSAGRHASGNGTGQ